MHKNACGDTCMERYLLLRSNRESGPFTLKELTEKGLLTTDLIWLEGESTCWKAPADIPELKDLAKEPESKVVPMKKVYPASVENTESVSIPVTSFATHSTNNAAPSSQASTWQNNDFYDPFPEDQPDIQWRRASRKKAWQQSLNIGANLFGLATLVIAVMLSAVMVKKAVDNMVNEPEEPTADAKEIVSENLRENATQHAALSTPAFTQNNTTKEAVTDTAKIIATDLPKVQTTTTLAKKETPKKKVSNALPAATAPTPVVQDSMPKNESEVKGPPGETEKPVAKPTLQVAANEYKVGLFGGISNLALTVNNSSSVAAQNITLEVEYLKPNGKVVGTKMVEAGSIAPGASKTVSIPDNGRGVSVRYRVIDN